MNNIEKFLKELTVYDCDLTKVRLGGPGDGGYVVLEELCQKTTKLITVGVGDDIGLELDFMNKFNPDKIILFDPTIDGIKEDHPKIEFHKKEFTENSVKIPLRSMLKIDIEWNEWDLLENLSRSTLEMFDQVLVEFHIIHTQPKDGLSPYFNGVYQDAHDKINQDLFFKYYSELKKLNEVFCIYHIHANNSLPVVKVEEGKGGDRYSHVFPPLLEVSFVHKELAGNIKPKIGTFPEGCLDRSNKSDRPDIFNWYPIC